jgi:cation:H+ antiporter
MVIICYNKKMDSIFITLLALLALFYILGKSADLAITNLRAIADKLGVSIFFLGLIMGFFTSFPETAIGINAIIDDVPNISLGNLFGGTIVLFGLILGISILLQRRIKADQSLWQIGMILVFLLVPVFLGLDGQLGLVDGFILLAEYFVLLLVIYLNRKKRVDMPKISVERGLAKHAFLFLVGIVLVLVIANFTVDLTVGLLSYLPLSKFVVGMVIFSIGTNFPEIIVALRAWKNKSADLSISHLLGSAITNILLIGAFSVMQPFDINIDLSYYILIAGFVVLFSLVFIFYKTDKMLHRWEGAVLVAVYLIFITLQIVFENPVPTIGAGI